MSTQMLGISVADFLVNNPACGKRIPIQQFDIPVYYVRDVFSLGNDSQALFPKNADGEISHVFLESYDHDLALQYHFHKVLQYIHSTTNEQVHTMDEAFFAASPWYCNFWHWFMEGFPKILIMESLGYSGCYIVQRHAHIMESLAMIGIRDNRIVYDDTDYFIKIMPILPRFQWHSINQNILRATRSAILDNCEVLSGSKHCYTKRIGSRKIHNEDDLLTLLARYDFEIMIPENLSLKEQFECISNSIFSIMPHGANCFLTLLQQKKSTFVEIFPKRYVHLCNLPIIQHLHLQHHIVVQNYDVDDSPDTADGKDIVYGDYMANIQYIKILLENSLGKKH